MGTTLTNGVYLPNEGERNCYAGLKTNWEILDQKVADVTALQQAVAGALHREIVESLPTTDIDPNTIYMILSGTSATENVYNEFMYVNNAWELIGTSATDLTNYYTKGEVDSKLLLKANDTDVVHKSGNETVGGIKSFSDDTYIKSLNFTNEVASTSSSSSAIFPIITTVTYTDQTASKVARINLRITASGDKSLYPHENNEYSLGLPSRSWSDFYTYHGYFRGQQQNDEYSSNARTNLTLLSNRDTVGQSGCLVDTFRENTSQGTGMHILGFGMRENSVRYEGIRLQWVYNSIDSGYDFNLKPNTQGTNKPLTYNLGTSTDKWSKVYANEYYYGSANTEFSNKFVTTDTAQTIVSNKTFVGSQYFKDNNVQYFGIDFSKGTAPSAYTARCTYFSPLTGGGSTYQTSNGLIGCAINNDNVVTTFMHAIKNTAGTTTRTSFVLYYDTDNDKRSVTTNGDFLPILTGQGIGNSTSKWSTINGLEPSSLGMPDLSNGIDISSYIDVTQTSQYTAPANGYISICGHGTSTNAILIKDHNYDFAVTCRAVITSLGQSSYVVMPVIKNHVYDITCSAVTAIDYAKFFPCLGNV